MTNASEIAALDQAWSTNPEESFAILLALGSEHLKTRNLMEARAVFERAQQLRPEDAEALNLLGLTIFKLGEFERAQQIFESLIDRFPDTTALELNIALVQIKSGKFEQARERLLKIVEREPHHPRAGSYLGLVYEQLGDLRAAGQAYRQAGNVEAAVKVERRLAVEDDEQPAPAPEPAPARGEHDRRAAEVDAALAKAAHAFEQETLPAGSVYVSAAAAQQQQRAETTAAAPGGPGAGSDLGELPVAEEPPEEAEPGREPTDLARLEALGRERAVTLLDGMVQVRLEDRALLRSDRWVGRFGDLKVEQVRRRQRGKETEEHLGGERPVVAVEGRGTALLRCDERTAVTASFDEEIFVIESRLLALLGACHHETGRLVMPDRTVLHLLRLRGRGRAVVATDRTPVRLRITLGPPLVVQASALVAFAGKVLPRVASSGPSPADEPAQLNLLGEGEVWVDGGTLQVFEIAAL